jgi:hypothetical protein
MFSLKTTLQDLAALPPEPPAYIEAVDSGLEPDTRSLYPNGHLPNSFDATKGIKSLLFPAAGVNAKMSSLSQYLYSQSGTVSLSNCTGSFYVRADGAGNWALVAAVSGSSPQKIAAGFVFMLSTDVNGHGCVSTEAKGNSPTTGWSVLAQGNDPWIAANWVQLFGNGVWFYLSQATGLNNLSPISDAATDHGFAGLIQLGGIYQGYPVWSPVPDPEWWLGLWGDVGP